MVDYIANEKLILKKEDKDKVKFWLQVSGKE
jgi:hypothetical protein